MESNDLQSLRSLVRKRRSAVSAKEKRIEKNTGVNIEGTKEDPRRPPSVVNKYNRNQLNTYLRQLNAFMSRDNGYYADASGGLISSRDFTRYRRIEKLYNDKAIADFNAVKNIKDPASGLTIAEREKRMVPEGPRAQGEIVHRPFAVVKRSPKNIKNAEALKKLEKDLIMKSAKGYLPAVISSQRKQAADMFKNAGILYTLDQLNDFQFNALWNYTGFATRLGQIGSSGSHRGKAVRELDRFDPLSQQDKDDIADDVQFLVDEAKKWKEPRKK